MKARKFSRLSIATMIGYIALAVSELTTIYTAADDGVQIEEQTLAEDDNTAEEQELIIEPKEDTYNTIIIAKSDANIRDNPNLHSNKLGVLYKGCHLDKVGEYEDFYMVSYMGKIAYVYKDLAYEDVEIIPYTDIKQLAYVENDTYMYDSPDAVKEVMELPQYEVLEVLSEVDNYYVVRVNDSYGYVNKDYTLPLSDKVVVVDVSDQHLKFYDNNQVVFESDVVTGGKGHETNLGYQNIRYVGWGVTLVGRDYRQPVDVFAPFNQYGEGFHDAQWRDPSDFGGETYLTHGSHGCVNMPEDKAKTLCKQLIAGDEVIIKR
jgi:hypothetical protein